MTTTLAPPEDGATAVTADSRAARYRDAHRILDIAALGLPFPAVSQRGATFFFTGAPDAATARRDMRDAEAVLAYALKVTFRDHRPEPIGSTRHLIRKAELPSGMVVELAALAEHIDGQDARKPVAA